MQIQTGDPLLDIALSDRDWRLDNLYQILTEDAVIVPFKARPEQKEFRARQHHCNIVPKARKLGMSTEIVIENLDACIFNDNYRAAIIDLTEPDSWDKLGIAKLAWENGVSYPDQMIADIWKLIYADNPLVANSNSEMRWANGSRFEAGISFTGGTLQSLHVSELGPIASQKPKKAEEIRRGSMNAVVQNGRKTIETTMEGGRFGVCFEYFELALANGNRDDLEKGEWRLHFFPWINHPAYRLPGKSPKNADTIEYFRELSVKYGDEFERLYGWREVPQDRQAWYEMKKRELRDEIYQQFPTVIEECVRTTVAGQIYPEIAHLRATGRVREFQPDTGIPLCTYWDLGSGANLSGWLIQKTGKDINVIDWTWGEGKGAGYMADVIRHWRSMHGSISCNFLPHDADTSDKGSGKTYRTQLIDSGINSREIRVVPRVRQIWDGIEQVRKRLPNMWFHSRTDESVVLPDGTKLPGGLGRVEAYRMTPNSASGIVKGVPFGDFCSHSCFPAGTMVLLDRGEVPIEDVRAGDWVVTPAGLAHVEAAGVVKTATEFVSMEIDGRSIRCTPDHMIFTKNGLVRADAMRTSDDAWTQKTSLKLLSLTEFGISYRDVITSPLRASVKITAISIGRFGRIITDLFRQATTSITRTLTTSTTLSKIWSACPKASIANYTPPRILGSAQPWEPKSFWKKLSQPLKRGTVRQKAEHGTRSTRLTGGRIGKLRFRSANIAEMSSGRPPSGNTSVEGCASNGTTMASRLSPIGTIALFAAKRFLRRLVTGNTARKIATTEGLNIAERSGQGQREPVYDLTVSLHHCYYANGVLVSNCDALRTFAEADWHNLVDTVGHSMLPGMARLQMGDFGQKPQFQVHRGPATALWRR